MQYEKQEVINDDKVINVGSRVIKTELLVKVSR